MYRTQDLVINAVPGAAEALRLCVWGTRICIRPTVHCGFPTIYGCWRWTWITCWQWTYCPLGSCYNVTFHCPGGSILCEFGTRPGCFAGSRIDPGDVLTDVINPATIVVHDVADIKTLRTQLQDVVAQLGEFEKGGLDVGTFGGGSLEEQEKALRQALDEVQAQRKKGGSSK
jgi:hypothetical protein